MRWESYRVEALKTLNKAVTDSKEKMNNGLLGLIGETGELADHFKKHFYQGHELDANYIVKECGDICWYIALCEHTLGAYISEPMYDSDGWDVSDSIGLTLELSRYVTRLWDNRSDKEASTRVLHHMLALITAIATVHGATLSDVLDKNVEKLSKRYKGQEFSSEQSVNRGE